MRSIVLMRGYGLMRYAARVDASQDLLVRYLRAHGITVSLTHRFPGFVDAVAGWQSDIPRTALIELKTAKGKLTKRQKILHADVFVWVVRDERDADRVIHFLKTGEHHAAESGIFKGDR